MLILMLPQKKNLVDHITHVRQVKINTTHQVAKHGLPKDAPLCYASFGNQLARL